MAGFMEDWVGSGGKVVEQISLPQFFLLCHQFNPFCLHNMQPAPSWLEGIGWNSLFMSSVAHWVYPCREHTVSSLSWNHTPSCLSPTQSALSNPSEDLLKILDLAWCHLLLSGILKLICVTYVSDTSLSKRFIMLLLWFCSVHSILANDNL